MNLDIFKEELSDRKKVVRGITKDQINSELMANGYPALYIETDSHIIFCNSTLTIDEISISLPGLTLIEVVKRLRENSIDAYITRNSIGMLPAELLIDFDNKIIITENVDISPKNIDEIHDKSILNIPALEESSILKTIVYVYSVNENRIYGTNNEIFSYYREGNRLFTNGLLEDTEVMIEYDINKFFIYINDENVIELNKLLDDSIDSINNKILLNNVNSNNWDKV